MHFQELQYDVSRISTLFQQYYIFKAYFSINLNYATLIKETFVSVPPHQIFSRTALDISNRLRKSLQWYDSFCKSCAVYPPTVRKKMFC